jgi:hypothetical protein
MSDGTQPPRGENGNEDLLPGWSSLVILLTIFAVLSGVTLLSVLRGSSVEVAPETGGTREFGPADFTDVDFDEPLLEAVREAGSDVEPSTFVVPPPPFSDEGLFPCSACHADLEPDPTPRKMEYFHEDIELKHGDDSRWCFDCHNADDRDHLRLVSGELIDFDESYRLCGQCHGTIYRDWREGIHGRRRGYWNGAKSYLLCAHCHNPHAPAFRPLHPLPPPVRPDFLRSAAEEASHE